MSARWALVLVLLATAALPAEAQAPADAPVGAQAPAAVPARRWAVTGGMLVSYAGLGVAGEVDLWPRRISGVVGVGGFPGWIPFGLAGGLRFRLRGPRDPIYVQLSGVYFDNGDLYGPAVQIGRSNDSRRGTLHFALGAGRAVNGSITPAFDVGYGFYWGAPRRKPGADVSASGS